MDVGNSRIKWCVSEGAQMVVGAPMNSRAPLGTQLDAMWAKIERPHVVGLSNVAGTRVGSEISNWIQENWGVPIFEARSEPEASGMICGYREPKSLGVDRWLAMLGAYQRFGCPFIVVDLGTAVTIDVVDQNGVHLGGYLLPGRSSMAGVLSADTSAVDVPYPDFETSFEPGANTRECLERGILLAIIGAIEHVSAGLTEHLGLTPRLVLTGGDAEWARAALGLSCEVDDLLVFRGLMESLGSWTGPLKI